jgi:hypothetical protein
MTHEDAWFVRHPRDADDRYWQELADAELTPDLADAVGLWPAVVT